MPRDVKVGKPPKSKGLGIRVRGMGFRASGLVFECPGGCLCLHAVADSSSII